MKVTLKRLEAEGDEFAVSLTEDDDSKSSLLGKVKRTGPNEWQLYPRAVNGSTSDIAIALQAATPDELAEVIAKRFGVLDIAADRLRETTMSALVEATLSPLISLASHTDSMGGVLSAIGRLAAAIIANEIPASGEAEVMGALHKLVQEEVAQRRARNAVREHFTEALRELFTASEASDEEGENDDGSPTKH